MREPIKISLDRYLFLTFQANKADERKTPCANITRKTQTEKFANYEKNSSITPDKDDDIFSIASPVSATPQESSSEQQSRIPIRASTVPTTRSSKKKTRDDLIEKAFAKLLSSNYDEYDVVGNNVACKLRRMEEDQRAYAEYLINNILFYGYQKKLNSNTDIILDGKLFEDLGLNSQPIYHH
ncbi:hypothetical protein MML48_4g00019087 [Holotrichia oblita]|uniref:Uncharacterized protein n=1 Tax=Holotrichia oblita TaxID=644536 RepID=A0ACB9T9X2_HOLOL|nr:hypothetical protein MML48_4g00019087 [Holotrichia oblita]